MDSYYLWAVSVNRYPGTGDPELRNNEGMAYSCIMMLAEVYAAVRITLSFSSVSILSYGAH